MGISSALNQEQARTHNLGHHAINGHLRHSHTQRLGQLALLVHRTQAIQKLQCPLQHSATRRRHPIESEDVLNAQALQLEDEKRDIRSCNLWWGCWEEGGKCGGGEEAEAFAGRGSACSTGALVEGGDGAGSGNEGVHAGERVEGAQLSSGRISKSVSGKSVSGPEEG